MGSGRGKKWQDRMGDLGSSVGQAGKQQLHLPGWTFRRIRDATETGETGAYTCAILVNLHRSVVHLCHSLHLNMVAMTVVFPFAVNVSGEIFCHVIGEVIGILHLK